MAATTARASCKPLPPGPRFGAARSVATASGSRCRMDTARPTPDASTIARRRADFKALHANGCFMLPNPWDAGSARYLQSLGFQALATTSSGHAWSQAQAERAACARL